MSRSTNKTSSSIFPAVVLIVAVAGIILYAYNRSTIGANASNPEHAMSKEDVRKIVVEVIKDDPEIIISALENYQSKKMKEMEQKSKEAILGQKTELQNAGGAPVIGNPNGDVTIVEFFDYSCSYCKKVNKTLEQLVESDKNVRVIFRELPILGETSRKAAKAALAVYSIDQSKFMAFHNGLMEAATIDEKLIQDLAKRNGIDPTQLSEAMEKTKIEEELNKNQDLSAKVGIRGTPAFIVGEELLPGAVDIDTLKKKIEEARSKK